VLEHGPLGQTYELFDDVSSIGGPSVTVTARAGAAANRPVASRPAASRGRGAKTIAKITHPVTTLYFAYGSNMSSAELGAWCPTHRALGPAELPGHRLAFLRRSIRWGAGAVDIVRDPDRSVWGVVYELPLGLADLDQKEGAGFAYRRRDVEVLLEGSTVSAVAYEVMEKEPVQVTPRRDYVELLVTGAREHGLPRAYVAGLEHYTF
jgi:gamma-glutamylcyclotransferase (GGCT)/AIG2-like uncharacterized protein YtfP